MSEHPIQGLMKSTLENIKDMVDVNTIIGEAVETPDGTVIIPISRVAFGFAAGGSDYYAVAVSPGKEAPASFGGGSGAGVSVRPVGFLVCTEADGVRFVPTGSDVWAERAMDLAATVLHYVHCWMDKKEPDSQAERTHEVV